MAKIELDVASMLGSELSRLANQIMEEEAERISEEFKQKVKARLLETTLDLSSYVEVERLGHSLLIKIRDETKK